MKHRKIIIEINEKQRKWWKELTDEELETLAAKMSIEMCEEGKLPKKQCKNLPKWKKNFKGKEKIAEAILARLKV